VCIFDSDSEFEEEKEAFSEVFLDQDCADISDLPSFQEFPDQKLATD